MSVPQGTKETETLVSFAIHATRDEAHQLMILRMQELIRLATAIARRGEVLLNNVTSNLANDGSQLKASISAFEELIKNNNAIIVNQEVGKILASVQGSPSMPDDLRKQVAETMKMYRELDRRKSNIDILLKNSKPEDRQQLLKIVAESREYLSGWRHAMASFFKTIASVLTLGYYKDKVGPARVKVRDEAERILAGDINLLKQTGSSTTPPVASDVSQAQTTLGKKITEIQTMLKEAGVKVAEPDDELHPSH